MDHDAAARWRKRLEAHNRAREAGDPAAIRESIREAAKAAKAAEADHYGRARAALSAAYAKHHPGPDADGNAISRDIADAWDGLPEAAQRAVLADEAPPVLPKPIPAPEAAKLPRPERLLSAAGQSGAVLSIGEVCLLAGAGGVGKSALAGEIALAVADGVKGKPLLEVHGGCGPVLWLAWEEAPGEIGQRLKALAKHRLGAKDDEEADRVLGSVSIMDMRGWPLFGPGERHGAAGLYSARPERLAGWQALADAAGESPRLIVLDPVLSAYAGDSHAVAPAREFLAALCGLARDAGAGILALAHSTKAARSGDADPFDPGQIAGSAAWHDGVRGAMAMSFDPDDSTARTLAVAKANMGPARIICPATPRRADGSRWIIGFEAGGDWHTPAPAANKPAGGGGSRGGKRGGGSTAPTANPDAAYV